jgi:hypothetical protein
MFGDDEAESCLDLRPVSQLVSIQRNTAHVRASTQRLILNKLKCEIPFAGSSVKEIHHGPLLVFEGGSGVRPVALHARVRHPL